MDGPTDGQTNGTVGNIVVAHPKMLIGFACIDKSLYRIKSSAYVLTPP